MVNKALGWLYDQLDRPWQNGRLRLAFDKLNTRPFVRMLQDYDADITICTHFLPAEIISWLKAKNRLSCTQVIVVTDFDVHAMCHHCEHYFVALEETRVHLQELGIPGAKISVSGIPIDPIFAIRKEKSGMRRKHGLDLEKTTILVSAGGFGVGPIQNLVSALSELRHRTQVLVICGHNHELKNRVDKLVPRCPEIPRSESKRSASPMKWTS